MTFTDISQIGMDQGRPQASRETANSRQAGPDDSGGQDARPEGLQAAQQVSVSG
jgi:hypothetical protein